MFSNSRGGVPVYLPRQVTGLRSTCSAPSGASLLCFRRGQVVSLKIRSRSISTTPMREINQHSGLSAHIHYMERYQNKAAVDKGVPFPCTIPAYRVESFYIDDTTAPPPSDNRRQCCRLSSWLVQDPLGKC